MAMRCEHVHILELRKFFFTFLLRIYQLRNLDEIFFRTCMYKIRNTGLTDIATAIQNVKDFRSSSL